MAKKSTDFDWEPKNRGDKLVSFLVWVIIVILMIYGALIYKNRKELFNLKQQKVAVSKPISTVVKVKKAEKELESRKSKPKTKVKIVKKQVPSSENIYKIDSKKISSPTIIKTNPKINSTKKKKDVITKIVSKKSENKVSLKEKIKKELSNKELYLRVYPFAGEKVAKDFFAKMKKQFTRLAFRILKVNSNVILLLKTKGNLEKVDYLKSYALKNGLKVEIFENEKAATNLELLKETLKEVVTVNTKGDVAGDYGVQIGSFTNAKSAEDLRKLIISQSSYKNVFIATGERNGKPYYKVRVGYFKDRASAENCGRILKAKFKNKIISYWVLKLK